MSHRPQLPRPGISYDVRNESEFRSAVEKELQDAEGRVDDIPTDNRLVEEIIKFNLLFLGRS